MDNFLKFFLHILAPEKTYCTFEAQDLRIWNLRPAKKKVKILPEIRGFSEVLREVLEKFQVPRGFSEFFVLAGPKQKTIRCLGGSGGTGWATHRPKRIFRSEMHFKHDLPHDVESISKKISLKKYTNFMII